MFIYTRHGKRNLTLCDFVTRQPLLVDKGSGVPEAELVTLFNTVNTTEIHGGCGSKFRHNLR
ncbi:Uncharacterised protein [Vibrio cholerae]|nr:Uncharacterised protein [Vibrio cholerae]CSI54722.1 Uncharacterised protein [Vibrio cholerae]